MKISHLLLLAAGVPLLAFAQTERSLPAAADANAAVAPLQYQSVFADYVAAKAPPQSPDKAWIGANRAVLGEDADAAAPKGVAPAAAPAQPAMPASMHGKHDHKGHEGAHP